MQVRIATWNIAGNQKYPEGNENPKYFIDELLQYNPDIILLQEVHFKDNYSFTKEYLGEYKYIFDSTFSPSHNNSEYNLGLSIVSRYPITSERRIVFSNPNVSKVLKSGSTIYSHDKGMQVCSIEGLCVANTQLLPLHVFNTSYEQESELCLNIEKDIEGSLTSPVVFAGDFNHPDPDTLFREPFVNLNLKDCLPGTSTYVYHEKNPDHIYISEGISCKGSEVIKTDSDHYLCIADIEA